MHLAARIHCVLPRKSISSSMLYLLYALSEIHFFVFENRHSRLLYCFEGLVSLASVVHFVLMLYFHILSEHILIAVYNSYCKVFLYVSETIVLLPFGR